MSPIIDIQRRLVEVGALPRRLSSRITVATDGCWLWTGTSGAGGYGVVQIAVGSRARTTAHRLVYELLVGPIPEGKQLDHLCRVRNCVNPAHVEPVTIRENVLRGVGPSAANARKTHCPKGHPLAGDNLVTRPRGGRECRTCHRARWHAWRARKVAA